MVSSNYRQHLPHAQGYGIVCMLPRAGGVGGVGVGGDGGGVGGGGGGGSNTGNGEYSGDYSIDGKTPSTTYMSVERDIEWLPVQNGTGVWWGNIMSRVSPTKGNIQKSLPQLLSRMYPGTFQMR